VEKRLDASKLNATQSVLNLEAHTKVLLAAQKAGRNEMGENFTGRTN